MFFYLSLNTGITQGLVLDLLFFFSSLLCYLSSHNLIHSYDFMATHTPYIHASQFCIFNLNFFPGVQIPTITS